MSWHHLYKLQKKEKYQNYQHQQHCNSQLVNHLNQMTLNLIKVLDLDFLQKIYLAQRKKVDYYYQISKATKEEEIDIIIDNLEIGFGVLPDETKTLTNVALLRINLTGTIIKKVEIFETEVKFLLKVASMNFNLPGLLESIQNFNHHNLVNYKYENHRQSGLNVFLRSFNVFPSLDLLFSFIKAIKGFI